MLRDALVLVKSTLTTSGLRQRRWGIWSTRNTTIFLKDFFLDYSSFPCTYMLFNKRRKQIDNDKSLCVLVVFIASPWRLTGIQLYCRAKGASFILLHFFLQVFFYKVNYVTGCVSLGEEYSDHIWVTTEEMRDLVDQKYYNILKRFLSWLLFFSMYIHAF